MQNKNQLELESNQAFLRPDWVFLLWLGGFLVGWFSEKKNQNQQKA